jgi:SsrA-binding protein
MPGWRQDRAALGPVAAPPHASSLAPRAAAGNRAYNRTSSPTAGARGAIGPELLTDTMVKSDKKKKKSTADPNERPIAENRKARHKFDVLETLECGVALVGSEVKSLRNGKLSLDEAYGRVREGEVWLMGADIPEYTEASQMNHHPKRPRKLLMHRQEIRKFARQAHEKGLTLVPLKAYFKAGKAKVLLGLCRGRKLHDKREALKQADSQREMQRTARRRSR